MESRRTFLKKSALTAAAVALPALSSCVTINKGVKSTLVSADYLRSP